MKEKVASCGICNKYRNYQYYSKTAQVPLPPTVYNGIWQDTEV